MLKITKKRFTDDATTDTLILRDYYSNLSTNQYNFVQVIGLSGKLYSRNYHNDMIVVKFDQLRDGVYAVYLKNKED